MCAKGADDSKPSMGGRPLVLDSRPRKASSLVPLLHGGETYPLLPLVLPPGRRESVCACVFGTTVHWGEEGFFLRSCCLVHSATVYCVTHLEKIKTKRVSWRRL